MIYNTRMNSKPKIYLNIKLHVFLGTLLFIAGSVSSLFATPQVSRVASFSVKTELYTLEFEEVLSQLNHPWGIAWYGASGVNGVSSVAKSTPLGANPPLLVTERNGDVWLVQENKIKKITNLPTDVYKSGQGGWFDVACTRDGLILLSYARGTGAENRTTLISFTLKATDISSNASTINAQQVTQVFEMNKPNSGGFHFGGVISLDESSSNGVTIYFAMGERNNRHMAQDPSNNHGTIIKITSVKKGVGGAVYINTAGAAANSTAAPRAELISYGHRNPQGIYFDPDTKLLYETEHGPMGGDELNLIEHNKNYGWPVISWGKEYGSGIQVGEGTTKPGLEQPIKYWDPSPAMSGLTGYKGDIFSKWNNNLLASALKFQQIYRIELDKSGRKVQRIELLLDQTIQRKIGRIRAIEQAPDGLVYIITDDTNGKMFQINKK